MHKVYTSFERFKTKTALRRAVESGARIHAHAETIGAPIRDLSGRHTIVGPSPYERKWFGSVVLRDGLIVSVK